MDPHIDNLFARAFDTLGLDIVHTLKELDPHNEYVVNPGIFAVDIIKKRSNQFVTILIQDCKIHLENDRRKARYCSTITLVRVLAEQVLELFE